MSRPTTAVPAPPEVARLHLDSLMIGLALMLGGTAYPPLLAAADGRADHALATAWLWAMSAGFVHGVGFVPRARVWRLLWGRPALWLALAAAAGLRWGA